MLSVADSLKTLNKKVPRNVKFAFITAIILGFATHMFFFTNKLPNHDEFFGYNDLVWYTSQGRWFAFIAGAISSGFNMPWVNGLLSIVYIAIAAGIVVSCFQIKTDIMCVLAAGLMVTFPVVFSSLIYISYADTWMMALVISCLAIYLTNKYKFGWIFGTILIVFALAIYQSYFSIATGLAVGIIIIDIFKNNLTVKQVLAKAVRFVVTLVLGIVLYLLSVKLFAAELTSYQGIDQMGNIPLERIPSLFVESYKSIVRFFFFDEYNIFFGFLKYLFIGVALLAIVFIVITIVSKKIYRNKAMLLLMVLAIFLYPLATNIVYMMNAEDVYINMVYALVLLPVGVIALIEVMGIPSTKDAKTNRVHAFKNIAVWFTAVTFAIAIYSNFIIANKGYFRLHLVYEQGYAYSVTVMTRIQSIEGYSEDKTILMVGTPKKPNPDPNYFLYELNPLRVTDPFIPETYSYPRFLQSFLGVSQPVFLVQSGQLDKYGLDVDVTKDMATYPNNNSIKVEGDYILVCFNK